MQYLAFVNIAYADVDSLIGKINKVIINPAIILIFSVALVVFLWGVFEFLSNAESDDARTTGKSHMLWGIVGMFIMMAVFTIMNIIAGTIGATNVTIPK